MASTGEAQMRGKNAGPKKYALPQPTGSDSEDDRKDVQRRDRRAADVDGAQEESEDEGAARPTDRTPTKQGRQPDYEGFLRGVRQLTGGPLAQAQRRGELEEPEQKAGALRGTSSRSGRKFDDQDDRQAESGPRRRQGGQTFRGDDEEENGGYDREARRGPASAQPHALDFQIFDDEGPSQYPVPQRGSKPRQTKQYGQDDEFGELEYAHATRRGIQPQGTRGYDDFEKFRKDQEQPRDYDPRDRRQPSTSSSSRGGRSNGEFSSASGGTRSTGNTSSSIVSRYPHSFIRYPAKCPPPSSEKNQVEASKDRDSTPRDRMLNDIADGMGWATTGGAEGVRRKGGGWKW